jgi:hypothetical protein
MADTSFHSAAVRLVDRCILAVGAVALILMMLR